MFSQKKVKWRMILLRFMIRELPNVFYATKVVPVFKPALRKHISEVHEEKKQFISDFC